MWKTVEDIRIMLTSRSPCPVHLIDQGMTIDVSESRTIRPVKVAAAPTHGHSSLQVAQNAAVHSARTCVTTTDHDNETVIHFL